MRRLSNTKLALLLVAVCVLLYLSMVGKILTFGF
ncbi:hypothetical protein GGD88_002917 [Roseospira goensis]|uniref:Uncharacterized protein n=1 Tax=Roseospira goensis TaxID=391922 RepID=A0A7W6WLX4_9PROT|nr:hypothetical protein [Roseospira goensis]